MGAAAGAGGFDPVRAATGGRFDFDDLRQAVCLEELVERVWAVMAFLCRDDADALVRTRAATVLTLGLLQRMAAGQNPRDFTVEDWTAVVRDVEDYAVNVDDQAYSAFVFSLYATAIDTGVQKFCGALSEERRASIAALAEELRQNVCALEEGRIGEAAFVEDSLWVCLEAAVKLLSAMAFSGLGETGRLIENLSDFGVAYGRLTLRRREQAVLQDILASQGVLDEELRARYDAYRADLDAQSERFQLLVRRAFDVDVRQALMASADLARASGVPEEEVLDTLEDVDRFFLE